jgi:hypothetical protein
MKDQVFTGLLGVIIGAGIGAAALSIASSGMPGNDRRLVVTRPDGSEQPIKLYRADQCRRWGDVISLVAGTGYSYRCEPKQN